MWNDSRTLNVVANALYLAAALALCAGALIWLAQRPVFALRVIWLEGEGGALQHVTPASVRASIAGRLSGNFFTADLDRMRQVFQTVPWVRSASVRRQWPNALVVTIQERRALGLWNENRLLDTYGESFAANLGEAEADAGLPALGGPAGSEKLVAQRFADLSRWFAPIKLTPVSVALTQRYAWQVVLSNGATVDLGRDPGATAQTPGSDLASLEARVARFVQAYPSVESRLGRIAHADLRYPNGFAVTPISTTNTSQKKP